MRWLGLILRVALVAACLTYAVWDMDFAALGQSFGRVSGLKLAAAFAISIVQFFPLGFRLAWLGRGEVPYAKAWAASIVCLGVNNLLPARLGELAKAAYLKREARVPLGKALVMVFWERLFDLMVLLGLTLAAAGIFGHSEAIAPLVVVVGGLWIGVVLARYCPGFVGRIIDLVPLERLRLFAHDVLQQLSTGGSPVFFGVTGFWSVFIWAGYYVNFTVILNYCTGLGLSPEQLLVVFAVTGIGFAVPSSPGALGVVEAAAVWSLTQFGVAREDALTGAVLIHMTQYLPTVLISLYLMSRTGMSLKGLRAEKPSPSVTKDL